MKVVHLSQTDSGAGAGKAAWRIHRSLLKQGVDSTFLVSDKRTQDETVISATHGGLQHIRKRLSEYREAKCAQGKKALRAGHFSLGYGYFNPAQHPRVQSADIIALYWINGGFIAPEDLASLNKPIVWRLSDAWPFTGGCHYPSGCERFEARCGDCPQLARPSEYDASRKLHARKEKAWRNLNLTIAAPSTWIADLAKKSSLFSHYPVEIIPTGVDTHLFRPQEKARARAAFNIPQDKKVILFGAMDTADPRKGFSLLKSALERIRTSPDAANHLAVTFGANTLDALPIPHQSLGMLDSDEKLANAYSLADVMVVPSLEDNLPNTALEAIACGTPVVGFQVCGMPDIIQHQWNGYLCSAVNAVLLAEGVEWTLKHSDSLRENARSRALERFSAERQAESYVQLYRALAEK